MSIATSAVEVGVRELKDNLSRYLNRVKDGQDVIVTDHGRPVARLSAIDPAHNHLADLIAAGAVKPPQDRARRRPTKRVQASGPVSDLVADQRR